MNIAAIILAAGVGRRIGMPKWQLESDGKTFLDLILEKLASAGIKDIVCVVRKESVPPVNIQLAVNPTPEHGMLSSLFHGIKSCQAADYYLVFPVDHPFPKISSLQAICSKACSDEFDVIRPVSDGRPGHPVLISSRVSAMLPENYDGGLRGFLKGKALKVFDVEVNDQGILRNINVPDDINVDGT